MLLPPTLPAPEPLAGDGPGGSGVPRVRDPLPAPAPESPVDDAAFDAWLRRELHSLHGTVLSEPVPEHLLRVLEGGTDR